MAEKEIEISDEKVAAASGTAGSTLGGLGAGFGTCHAICQSFVAVFAVVGVSVIGMPLAFLTPYTLPLLVVSAALLGFSIWTMRKNRMPYRMLLRPVAIGLVVSVVIVVAIFSFSVLAAPARGQATGQPDKCIPPAGTSQEEWTEHMGHHPDMYRECLA